MQQISQGNNAWERLYTTSTANPLWLGMIAVMKENEQGKLLPKRKLIIHVVSGNIYNLDLSFLCSCMCKILWTSIYISDQLGVCVAELPEISPPTQLWQPSSCFVPIMNPPRAQCVATKTVSLFTLLLLFSAPTSTQDPGELFINRTKPALQQNKLSTRRITCITLFYSSSIVIADKEIWFYNFITSASLSPCIVAILTPQTYTAYLGQPDVRFHCSAVNASDFVWRIDGVSRSTNELAARGIGIVTNNTHYESTLTISSTTENNKTHIQCLTQIEKRNTLYFYIPSDKVVFQVQGQLANLTDSKLLLLSLPYSVLQVHWVSVMASVSTQLETTTSVSHGILHRPST